MKKTLLFSGLLLALTASMALAGGVNVTWGAGCWSDGAPQASATFACNTNLGGSTIFTTSFICNVDHPNFAGVETVFDGQSDTPTLPDWWQLFNSGACRQSALSTSAAFGTAPNIGCADPWGGLAAGGISAWQTNLFPPPSPANTPLPDRCRLKVVYALANVNPIVAGQEYYCYQAIITHAKTVGTGACAGCNVGMAFALNMIKVAEFTNPVIVEFSESAINNQCLSWQGAATPCSAVPAHNTTWGQVKSLYR